MEESGNNLYTASLQIPFRTNREAEIAYNTLVVDAEPKRSGVTKKLSVKTNILNINLSANEPRQLRTNSETKMSDNSPAPTPSRGIYGFVLFLGCVLCAILYLLWAYIPLNWMESVGITYLPQKYWAVAIPVYFTVGVLLFGCCFYPGLCLLNVKPLNSMDLITDEFKPSVKSTVSEKAIPPIADISLKDVCKVLHNKNE
ncbi:hypothetical protein CHUAL_012551 [Chamberlinius hualienensis]